MNLMHSRQNSPTLPEIVLNGTQNFSWKQVNTQI